MKNVAADQVKYIGCCGAYCRTCRPFIEGSCKGCKLGYDTGERDINKSKCIIKVCCLKERKLETCAVCTDYPSCKIIHGFYSKNGYKYNRYEQSMDYIRKNGYAKFIGRAENWKGACGKLE